MKGYPGGHFGHVGMIVYSLVVDDQYNLIGGEQSRKNTERIGSRDWTLSVHRGRGDADVLGSIASRVTKERRREREY